jgi:hypothetical protein
LKGGSEGASFFHGRGLVAFEACGANPPIGYDGPDTSTCIRKKGHPPGQHTFRGRDWEIPSGPSREEQEAGDKSPVRGVFH